MVPFTVIDRCHDVKFRKLRSTQVFFPETAVDQEVDDLQFRARFEKKYEGKPLIQIPFT